jgi:hypothetical protein
LLKTSWDRDMRERELQMQLEGEAFFSEADIDDAAELLIQQERAQRMVATHGTPFQPMSQISEGDESMMLDEMMQQEERELDERVMAYNELETQEQQMQERQMQELQMQEQLPASPEFGDDDEDFDAALMELVPDKAPDDCGMDLS